MVATDPWKPLKAPEIPLESIRPLKMSLKLPEIKKHPWKKKLNVCKKNFLKVNLTIYVINVTFYNNINSIWAHMSFLC